MRSSGGSCRNVLINQNVSFVSQLRSSDSLLLVFLVSHGSWRRIKRPNILPPALKSRNLTEPIRNRPVKAPTMMFKSPYFKSTTDKKPTGCQPQSVRRGLKLKKGWLVYRFQSIITKKVDQSYVSTKASLAT